MDKHILQKLIDSNLSQRKIAEKLSISQVTVRYWLKKYNLSTNKLRFNTIYLKKDKLGKRTCIACKKELNIENFYSSKNRIQRRCKSCKNTSSKENKRKVKLKMIIAKGGKCENCNVKLEDLHPSVFEFHHINPLVKDVNFGSIKGWNWKRIELELKKCKLLCANCHRMEHVILETDS